MLSSFVAHCLDSVVAFVVVDNGRTAEAALRSALARTLPAAAQPAHYVFLDALPLNRSGKVDQSALLGMLERAEALDPSAPIASGSSTASVIAVAFAHVLFPKEATRSGTFTRIA